MFKLGFAFLFAVFFACNCYENWRAEDPAEKREDAIPEEGGGSPSDEYDDGFAENNDAVDNDDEPSRDAESQGETVEERDGNAGFRDDLKEERLVFTSRSRLFTSTRLAIPKKRNAD